MESLRNIIPSERNYRQVSFLKVKCMFAFTSNYGVTVRCNLSKNRSFGMHMSTYVLKLLLCWGNQTYVVRCVLLNICLVPSTEVSVPQPIYKTFVDLKPLQYTCKPWNEVFPLFSNYFKVHYRIFHTALNQSLLALWGVTKAF